MLKLRTWYRFGVWSNLTVKLITEYTDAQNDRLQPRHRLSGAVSDVGLSSGERMKMLYTHKSQNLDQMAEKHI